MPFAQMHHLILTLASLQSHSPDRYFKIYDHHVAFNGWSGYIKIRAAHFCQALQLLVHVLIGHFNEMFLHFNPTEVSQGDIRQYRRGISKFQPLVPADFTHRNFRPSYRIYTIIKHSLDKKSWYRSIHSLV